MWVNIRVHPITDTNFKREEFSKQKESESYIHIMYGKGFPVRKPDTLLQEESGVESKACIYVFYFKIDV